MESFKTEDHGEDFDFITGGHVENVKNVKSKNYEILNTFNTFKTFPVPKEIDSKAFTGIFGRLSEKIFPHTEGDKISLLMQSIIFFGSMLPERKVFYSAEGSRTYMNDYLVLIGDSASGKGSTYKRIKNIFSEVNTRFIESNVETGLSSGEGLINRFKDNVYKNDGSILEKGYDDKRVLIYEPEFAQVLTVAERVGNTLSTILRSGFDGEDLRFLTKSSFHIKATKPYLNIISHITKLELDKFFSDISTANGFGNRFMWIYVKKSKDLAMGGTDKIEDYQDEIRDLKLALEKVNDETDMDFDNSATRLWNQYYSKLNQGGENIIGALAQRDKVHVRKIACINAIGNLRTQITVEDLELSLAIRDYMNESRRYLFGSKSGNPNDQKVINFLMLNNGTATRTEIFSNLFQKNKSSNEINDIGSRLLESDQITIEKQATNGRSTEIWSIKQ